MRQFKSDNVFIIEDFVKTREEDFGMLVVSRRAPAMCINNDAVKIWKMCDGAHSIKDMAIKLAGEHSEESTLDEYQGKIEKAINMLVNLNLIRAR